MKNRTGLILIHGSGLGSWIWEDLIPLLNYPVLAIDFPNRNSEKNANKSLHFIDYIDSVIAKVELWEIDQLIIVAHSIGGLVGLKLAEHFKNKLIGFVGISAAIPAKGGSFLSCMPFPQRFLLNIIMRLAGTTPPQSAIINGLCNDLSPSQTKQVVDNFTPEAPSLFFEKCQAPIPDSKSLYIKLSKDKEYNNALQVKMIRNLKAQHVVSLDSGHLPMLSNPLSLAKELNDFAKRCENAKT